MGGMATIVFFGSTFWLFLYGSVLVNARNRWLILISFILRFCGNNMMAASTSTNITSAGAKWLQSMNTVFFLPFVSAFLITPALMCFAKCVPDSIEGIMMGFINSVIKLNSDVIMRLLPLAFFVNSGVTIDNYDNL